MATILGASLATATSVLPLVKFGLDLWARRQKQSQLDILIKEVRPKVSKLGVYDDLRRALRVEAALEDILTARRAGWYAAGSILGVLTVVGAPYNFQGLNGLLGGQFAAATEFPELVGGSLALGSSAMSMIGGRTSLVSTETSTRYLDAKYKVNRIVEEFLVKPAIECIEDATKEHDPGE